MKIISVNIGNTHIEFDNNMWTGHESIYVNGELVSRKFSFFGTDHVFDVNEDGEWVEYVLTTGFSWSFGVTADITRNGIPVLESGGRIELQTSAPKSCGRSYRSDEFV